MMADILQRIVARKREEVADLRPRAAELRARAADAPPCRGFLAALRAAAGTALIAEVKKASPSKGILRADFDPAWIAARYADAGAACLSVLTDADFFQGSLANLAAAREAAAIPALRKDFLIDALQVVEARAAGADAVLLIADCLESGQLADLHALAQSLGMDVLVEVHNEADWERVQDSGARPPLVGINNRNLHDFSVTLETTDRLAPAILEAGALLVAESGIFSPADVARVRAAGARAVLVGESLVRQPDPGAAARALMDVRRGP